MQIVHTATIEKPAYLYPIDSVSIELQQAICDDYTVRDIKKFTFHSEITIVKRY